MSSHKAPNILPITPHLPQHTATTTSTTTTETLYFSSLALGFYQAHEENSSQDLYYLSFLFLSEIKLTVGENIWKPSNKVKKKKLPT